MQHFVFSLVDFCLGSTCPEPVYKPLTVCFEFSNSYYFVLISVEHNICPYMNFQMAVQNDVCSSNCDSDAAEMVVFRELYSL